MMSTDWILIEDMSTKNGTTDIDALQVAQLYMKNTEPCHAIGKSCLALQKNKLCRSWEQMTVQTFQKTIFL